MGPAASSGLLSRAPTRRSTFLQAGNPNKSLGKSEARGESDGPSVKTSDNASPCSCRPRLWEPAAEKKKIGDWLMERVVQDDYQCA